MIKKRTSSRGPVTAAKLAAVAILSLGFAITTHVTVANTLSPSLGTKTLPPAPLPATPLPQPLAKSKAGVGAPTITVLSERDAALYQTIFAAHKRNDWKQALDSIKALSDKRLLGHVLADRFRRVRPTGDQIAAWLNAYADHPQAAAIYAFGRKIDPKAEASFKQPTAAAPWGAGFEADSAANFDLIVKSSGAPQGSKTKKLITDINAALRRNDPTKARNLLIAGQAQGPLSGTVAADAEASVAALFFYMGERDQARSLSNAAAGAKQPLGLWIRGLIAWEQGDHSLAARNFTKLAEHPALDVNAQTAAHFWAGRALARIGKTRLSHAHFEEAAQQANSFYGFLAAQKLGRIAAQNAAREAAEANWSEKHQEELASHEGGWRALALLQIGEKALAETELRRLNPRGNAALQRAMSALAQEAAMPSLAVQLASLTRAANAPGRASAHYPMLPWQPKNGFEVDRALIFALARHESQFDPEAVSHRGARGLMQIMPATAKEILDDDTVQPDDRRLLDPAHNLALGQKYVRQLARHPQIGDNLLLLLAAYNGGPNKVARWIETRTTLAADGKLDPLLFIESMPLRETRNYVKRVMANYWNYQTRFNEPTDSLKQLSEGLWPRVAFERPAVSSVKMASN